ncbi:hypothetical protein SAMN04488509_11310 [Aquimonas voraii]|uniref:Uncharacterized protein n=1 Tax=Aquimonas voraii TaxID=265719 RepID=A0A1G6Z9I7_9GAMM|nr:hypothetical protein SAMN04488509_11310 [Aquimonas voraii]
MGLDGVGPGPRWPPHPPRGACSTCPLHAARRAPRSCRSAQIPRTQGLQKSRARSSGFPQFFALTPGVPGRSVRGRCPLDLVVSPHAKPYRLGSLPGRDTTPSRREADLAANAQAGGGRANSAAEQAVQRETRSSRHWPGGGGRRRRKTRVPSRARRTTRTHQSRRRAARNRPDPSTYRDRSASCAPFRPCRALCVQRSRGPDRPRSCCHGHKKEAKLDEQRSA